MEARSLECHTSPSLLRMSAAEGNEAQASKSLETSSLSTVSDAGLLSPRCGVMFIHMLSGFVDAYSYSFLVSFAPDALQVYAGVDEQHTAAQVALLYSIFSISALCGNAVIGICVSRNSRATFVISAMVLCFSAVLFAYSRTMPYILLARAIQGVASAGNWTASLTMLAESFSPDELGPAVGKVFMLNSAGALVGPLMGGILYDFSGGVELPALSLALLSGIEAITRCCVKPSTKNQLRQPPQKLGLWPLLTSPRILCICVIVLLGSFCQGFFRPIIASTLQKQGISPTSIGSAFMAMAVGSGLGANACGKLSSKWPNARSDLVLFGQVMVAFFSIFVALPYSSYFQLADYRFEAELFACAGLGAACAFFMTPNVTRVSEEVTSFYVNATPSFAFIFSIYNFCFTLGDMLGPLAGGLLLTQHGELAACCAVSCLALFSMTIVVAGEKLPMRTLWTR